MEDDLYDEFGNYVGPEVGVASSSSDSESEGSDQSGER